MEVSDLIAAQLAKPTGKSLRADNTSGTPGVYRCGDKWRAEIRVGGRKRCLGTFADKQAAIDARAAAEAQTGLSSSFTASRLAQSAERLRSHRRIVETW